MLISAFSQCITCSRSTGPMFPRHIFQKWNEGKKFRHASNFYDLNSDRKSEKDHTLRLYKYIKRLDSAWSAHTLLSVYPQFHILSSPRGPPHPPFTFPYGEAEMGEWEKPIYPQSDIICWGVYLWHTTPQSTVDSTWYSINLPNENLTSVINK